MAKKLTRQQYWEVIIVVTILLIIAYRVALVYDYIPEEYHPSVLADDVYQNMKSELKGVAADQSNAFSDSAQWSVERLDAIEVYLQERKLRYERAEEVSKRCNENMIFRFFMYMGDEDNPNCTEKNLVIENATKDINEQAKKPGPNPQANPAPAQN